MMSEKTRTALAATNFICLIGGSISGDKEGLNSLDLDSIVGEPATKIRMSCKGVGEFAVSHCFAARSEINDLMEIADAEYPKQPTTAAVKFFGLLTAAAAEAKRFEAIKQKLSGINAEEADQLALMGDEISQIAVEHFGLYQAEADRLKNQALAMAGLKGNPVLMLTTM